MITDQITYDFLKLLDDNSIKYHYEDEWLIVDGDKDDRVILMYIEFVLPDYIKFNNSSHVDLRFNGLINLSNLEFNNNGHVIIASNESVILSVNIKFNNDGYVDLSFNNLSRLPNDIQFNNNKSVSLSGNPLTSLPDNIEDFYDKLNKRTKNLLKKKFSEHWFFEKERFGL